MKNKSKKEKRKNVSGITSGIGTVSYPSLLEPKYNELSEQDEYEVTLMFNKSESKDVDSINAIFETIDKVLKLNPDIDTTHEEYRTPVLDGDSKVEKNPEYANHWCVKFKTNAENSIQVLSLLRDASGKLKPIIDEDEIYGGCKGRVHFNAFAYKKGNKQGVSFALSMFQKTGEGEPFGTKADPNKAFSDSDEYVDSSGELVEDEM